MRMAQQPLVVRNEEEPDVLYVHDVLCVDLAQDAAVPGKKEKHTRNESRELVNEEIFLINVW